MFSAKVLHAGTGQNVRNAVTVGSNAGAVAREGLRPIIDTLFENLQLVNAGALVLSDLRGNVPLPKIGRSTARPIEKAETAAATELSPTTDEVILRPHRIPAYIIISKIAAPAVRCGSPATELSRPRIGGTV